MRRILIERARQKQSLKAGGDRGRVELDAVEPAVLPLACGDLLGLDEVLQKLEQKEFAEAETAFRAVIRLTPELAFGHWLTGHVRRGHRFISVAATALHGCCRLLPGSGSGLEELQFHLERDADEWCDDAPSHQLEYHDAGV